MRRAEAIDRLRKHRAEFVRLGVARMQLFGSIARDEADENSDVDVIVDTEDGQAFGLFKLANIADELERVLGRKADVFSRRGLDYAPKFHGKIGSELIDVF